MLSLEGQGKKKLFQKGGMGKGVPASDHLVNTQRYKHLGHYKCCLRTSRLHTMKNESFYGDHPRDKTEK